MVCVRWSARWRSRDKMDGRDVRRPFTVRAISSARLLVLERKDLQGAQTGASAHQRQRSFQAIIHTALGVLGAWLHHATAWHALAARPLLLFRSANSARAANYFLCAEARGEPRAGEQQQRRKQQQ